MSFFDRKEEVIEIQLTPHGRYLLSLGEWQPVYYSFFDDDVVYDSDYIGYSEEQNNTENRIKETPRPHCQATFKTAEFNVANVAAYDDRKLQNYFEREYALNSQLGVADYYSDKLPAWDIDFLKGKISNSSTTYSGAGPNYTIPQLDAEDPTYKKIVGSLLLDSGPDPLFDDEDLRVITRYPDKHNFVEIRKDFILLEINEINTLFQKDNFEIEVFMIEEETEGSTDTEVLIPLKFGGPRDNQTEYVDYYFNIDVDMEVSERMLCKYKGVDSTKGLFLQRESFDCGTGAREDSNWAPATTEPPGSGPTNPYRTNIPPDDIEVCD